MGILSPLFFRFTKGIVKTNHTAAVDAPFGAPNTVNRVTGITSDGSGITNKINLPNFSFATMADPTNAFGLRHTLAFTSQSSLEHVSVQVDGFSTGVPVVDNTGELIATADLSDALHNRGEWISFVWLGNAWAIENPTQGNSHPKYTAKTPYGESFVGTASMTDASDAGFYFVCPNGGGAFTNTLPPAVVQTPVLEINGINHGATAGDKLQFNARGTDKIRDVGTLGAAGGHTSSVVVGSTIKLVCVEPGIWDVFMKLGTWVTV